MVWTQEMRDKAQATRLAKKQAKIQNVEAVKPQAMHLSEVGTWSDGGVPPVPNVRSNMFVGMASSREGRDSMPFDWENCPLVDAINKQADMRREYERISAIVLKRQNPPGRRWTCWTELHKDMIRGNFSPQNARAVLQSCLKTGEDGRQSFRDDGRFVIENGVKRLQPAFCCNAFCFRAYQQLHKLEQTA
jgi:hypothetical protein